MRVLINNIVAQTDDFLHRWKGMEKYTIAASSCGERLQIKVREDSRIRQLSGNNSPAVVSDKYIYLSLERAMTNMSADLVRFIIAHEVGHWVHRHYETPKDRSLSSRCLLECQADDFAVTLYGHRPDIILLVKQEFNGMLARADRLISEAKDYREREKITVEKDLVISRWNNLHEKVKS